MTTAEEYFKDKDADFFNNREKLMEGVEFCNNYLSRYGDDAKAYYWKGYCYSCLNINIEKALHCFNKSIELNPDDAQSYLMRGNCYNWLKQHKNAIVDFKKGIELESYRPTHSSMISGFKHNLTGVLVEIREICDEHYNTAEEYVRAEDWDSAIEESLAAIEEYSAIDCVKDEDYFEEIDNESRGWDVSILTKIAFVYDNLACCYEELEEYEDALIYMNEVIDLCSNEGCFYQNRAQVYRKMENYEKAIEDYSLAIDLFNSKDDSFDFLDNTRKNLINSYINRGYCYSCIERYDKAVKDYSKVSEFEPENIRNYFALGTCYQELKQYGKAAESYSKIIDLCEEECEDMLHAYLNKIDCYLEIKDYNSAKSDCEYLLDNKAVFLPYAEDDVFEKTETIINELEQLTEGDNYDEDGNDYEEDALHESVEHLKKSLLFYDNNKPGESLIEFYKAYMLNSDAVVAYINHLRENGPTLYDFYSPLIEVIKKIEIEGEALGLGPDEISDKIFKSLTHAYQMSNNANNIDISALHHDPKKGRKLDL